MLLFIFVTCCVVSTLGYSVLDGEYVLLESDTEELRWPDTYSVKALRFSLTSNIVEDYTAWKTNQSSRVDYNQGAVKSITLLPDNSDEELGVQFEIHPETTEEELNKIVCRTMHEEIWSLDLEDILPNIYQIDEWNEVGNETIEGIETVKFEYKSVDDEITEETIWAYYVEEVGWFPARYETIKYNKILGSLTKHEIWKYFDFVLDVDLTVFNYKDYNCSLEDIYTADSDEITKQLMFINPENEKHVDHVFNHFRNKYSRKYAHEHEHTMRRNIFKENMRMISSVNKRSLGYKLGINQFSDMTPQEKEQRLGAIPRPQGAVGTSAFPYEETKLEDIVSELPKGYDMRIFGLISPIKNQESCGSCWTFAATAVVESGYARVNGGRVLALSNQAIVDCAYDELGEMGAGGCHGGFDFAAYSFIMKHGLPTEEEYGPYKNRDGYCHIGNVTKTYPITGYTTVTPWNNNAMKVALVNHGPLFIYIHVSHEFMSYSSGIFYQTIKACNPDRANHAVTLVGYGERDGEEFWILKNSWGTEWGVDGFMLISTRDNVCGVASSPSYVIF